MSSSKFEVKRRICDEHRQFQEKWEIQYFFVEHRNTPPPQHVIFAHKRLQRTTLDAITQLNMLKSMKIPGRRKRQLSYQS